MKSKDAKKQALRKMLQQSLVHKKKDDDHEESEEKAEPKEAKGEKSVTVTVSY